MQIGNHCSHRFICPGDLNGFCQMWQGINLRATDMNDTARSFSSMAKEMLRIAEKDKGTS